MGTYQDGGRHIRSLVPSPKKKCGKRIHHSLPEILGQSKEAQERIYGEQREQSLKHLNSFQDTTEFPDVGGEALCKWGGKDIGPKVFAFTKTDSVEAKGGEKEGM